MKHPPILVTIVIMSQVQTERCPHTRSQNIRDNDFELCRINIYLNTLRICSPPPVPAPLPKVAPPPAPKPVPAPKATPTPPVVVMRKKSPPRPPPTVYEEACQDVDNDNSKWAWLR